MMIHKKRLTDDVSVQELMEFRAEGYSNSEIADMLDVTPTTIWRLIGANPPEISGRRRREGREIATDRRIVNEMRMQKMQPAIIAGGVLICGNRGKTRLVWRWS